MNGKQLKNSILQWAIQGKLVEQNPKDEPASKLLERIAAQRVIASGAKQSKKNLASRIYREGSSWFEQVGSAQPKDITEEIPFDIPESWEWCRLKDIFETSSGSTPLSSRIDYYKNGSINWVRTTDLNNGILNHCEKKITELAQNDYKLSFIPRNSICIAMYGGKGTIGKYALIDFDTTINQSVCAIFPNDFCNPFFYFFYMQYFRPFWMDFAAGSRKDPNINQIIIKNCFVPVPPVNEQKKISKKLEQILPLVDEYDQAQTQLDKLNKELPETLKKSILQQAIQGKLVPQNPKDEPAQELLERILNEKSRLVESGVLKKKDEKKYVVDDDEVPYEIPSNWVWTKLGNLLSIVSDGTHKTPNYVNSGIPFLSVQNISSGKLTLDKIKYVTEEEHEQLCSRIHPQKGDVLVCRIGTLGKALKVSWDFEFSIFVSLGLLRPVLDCITDYIVLYINSPLGYNWIQENKVGGGTHTYKINLGDLPNMLIPLPPLAEQKRIVAKLEQLFKAL